MISTAQSNLNTSMIEKHLFNLGTIAHIPKGKRISTSDEFINIEGEYALQPLVRAYNRDSRKKAVSSVCDVVKAVIEYSDLLIESKYLDVIYESQIYDKFLLDSSEDKILFRDGRNQRILYLKKIKSALCDANEGIDNLCETYSSDANVVAKLKPIIAGVNNQVSKLTKLLIELNENSEGKFATIRYDKKED
jgi:hypothetical protein